jgi:AcrR family transcriptional regulator
MRGHLQKDALIERLVDVVYDYGYDGATLSLISEVTGLGKASLYHHFPGGKEQMAAEVLAHSDRWGAQHIGNLLSGPLPAEAKVRGLFRALDEVHTRAHQLTLMNVFTYGAARLVFGRQVGERVRAGLGLLAGLLRDCGVPEALAQSRALDAYIRIEGAMVLARTLDDLEVFRRVVRALPDELLQRPEPEPVQLLAVAAE